jgi:hypothetical protein
VVNVEGDVTDSKDALLAPAPPLADRVAEKAVGHFLPDASPETQRLAARALAPWVEKLVRVLDDAVRIPGTNFGIGLDAVVGALLPGAGDFLTSLGSLSLLFVAFRERVPTVVLLRMVVNILVDTIGGLLPVVGDVFDLFWRSNKMNLELLKKHRDQPDRKATAADYAIVTAGAGFSIAGFVIPTVIFFTLGAGAIVGITALISKLFH